MLTARTPRAVYQAVSRWQQWAGDLAMKQVGIERGLPYNARDATSHYAGSNVSAGIADHALSPSARSFKLRDPSLKASTVHRRAAREVALLHVCAHLAKQVR